MLLCSYEKNAKKAINIANESLDSGIKEGWKDTISSSYRSLCSIYRWNALKCKDKDEQTKLMGVALEYIDKSLLIAKELFQPELEIEVRLEAMRLAININMLELDLLSKSLENEFLSPYRILEIIERKLTGTFHLSGAERISRYEFAKVMAESFNLYANLISPCSSADFSWSAKRPRDSSLNTAKAQQTLKNKPLQIRQALEIMKQELNQ